MASGRFNEVQISKLVEFKNSKQTQIGLGGNFPAQGTQVDWVVDLGVDLPCFFQFSKPGSF